jgi:hypothetical protein
MWITENSLCFFAKRVNGLLLAVSLLLPASTSNFPQRYSNVSAHRTIASSSSIIAKLFQILSDVQWSYAMFMEHSTAQKLTL